MGFSRRAEGVFYIALSALGFGAMAIFAKIAYGAGVGLAAMLFLRFLIGGLALAAVVLARRSAWPRGRDLALLTGMGAVGYVSQAYCYFAALRHASAGLTALLLYLYPALVAMMSAALGRQALTPRRLLAVAATFGGLLLTLGGPLDASSLGIAFGVGAALLYAIYILVGEGVTARCGPLPSAALIMLAAAMVYGLLFLRADDAWPSTATGWLAVTAMALFSTVLAMAGFFAGMERLGAADAATLSTLEPVVTIALAAVFLGEPLALSQLLGGGVILAAVVALARSR